MDELRVKVGIFGLVIMFAFCWFFMDMQQRAIQGVIEDSSEDKIHGDPEKLKEYGEKIETAWNEAFQALKTGKYDTANEAYQRATGFEFEIGGSGHMEFKPGVNLSAWCSGRKKEFGKTLVNEFEAVTRRAVDNPLESGPFQEYFDRFRNAAPELEKLYQGRKAVVVGARIKASGKWFRLAFSTQERQYLQSLEDAFKNQWNKGYGKTLVCGPSMDNRELAATWMTLSVQASVKGASYTLKSRGTPSPGGVPLSIQVPESVVITFQMKKLVPIPTTWDSLPSITVFEKAPELVQADGGNIYSELEAVAEAQKKKLLDQLQKKSAGITAFRLFPGKEPSSLALLKNGQIDADAVRMLGCLDPGKLAKEAGALSSKNDPALEQKLMELAVEQDLESLGDWVTEILEKAEGVVQKRVLGVLAKKPAYGEFQPILVLVEKAPSDEERAAILRNLKGWLYEEKVRQAFLAAIANRANKARSELVAVFLEEIPTEQAGQYSFWLQDPDKDFANTALAAISRKDPESRDKMMVSSFGGADPELKIRMLSDFHFNPRIHGKAEIEMLKKAASGNEHERIQSLGLKILMEDAARSSDGWKALEEVSKGVRDPEMASRIRQVLAASISEANPAGAADYQLKALLGNDAEQRKAAAQKYFRGSDPIDKKMKTIAPHLSKYQAEPGFFEALLRGLSEQGMSHLKDPGLPELEQMMTMAVTSSDTMVRYLGYSICHRACTLGQKKFVAILERGVESETNEWARGQGKMYLEGAKGY